MKKSLITVILILFIHTALFSQWTQCQKQSGRYSVSAVFKSNSKLYQSVLGSGIYLKDEKTNSWELISDYCFYKDRWAVSGDSLFMTLRKYTGHGLRISGEILLNLNKPEEGKQQISYEYADHLIYRAPYLYANTLGDGFVRVDTRTKETKEFSSNLPTTLNGKYHFVYAIEVTGDYYYAGTKEGLYRSSDLNADWELISNDIRMDTISYIKNIGSVLFASTRSDLYRSEDKGDSWTKCLSTDSDIRVIEGKGSSIYVGTEKSGVYKSVDGGKQWIEDDPMFKGMKINSICLDGAEVYCGTNNLGLFKFDGSKWINDNNGVFSSGFMEIIPLGDKLIGESGKAVYIIDKDGSLEEVTPKSDKNIWRYEDLKKVENRLFLLASLDCRYENNILFTSDDNGKNWVEIALPIYEGYIHMYANDKDIYMLEENKIYLSSDLGESWQDISCELSPNKGSVHHILSFQNSLYLVNLKNDVFVRRDGKWDFIKDQRFNGAEIHSFVRSENIIYAIGKQASFMSVDGLEWKEVSTPACTNGYLSVGSLYKGDKLFVFGKEGVFYTTSSGETWVKYNEGLKYNDIFDLSFIGNTLYASGAGHGLYRTPLARTDASTVKSQKAFTIYPNPACDYLSIESKDKNITQVRITDMSGKLMKLVEYSGNMIDIKSLPKGTYTMELTGGKKTYSEILLVK
ncbi:MAG: T9SS type A sorting domain-containing protein [Hyphomicrobiales bacterium]